MQYRTHTHKNTHISYHVRSLHPELLLVSGIHGDEYEVIDIARQAIEQQARALPPFMYIPVLSPSAASAKTRTNGDGIDLNRSFCNESPYEEVQAIMSLVRPHRFKTCLSFHEDGEHDAFYMYDSSRLDEERLDRLRRRLRDAGVALFSGVDDPADPSLGFELCEGYMPNAATKPNGSGKPFEEWLVAEGIAGRMFGTETPGKAPIKKKREIVEIIINELACAH